MLHVSVHQNHSLQKFKYVGKGLLIIEVLLSPSDTPQSVGLLWMSDQLDATVSTRQHTKLVTKRHSCLLVGFKPAISAIERRQTDAADRGATGIIPVNTAESKFSLLNIFLEFFFIVPSEHRHVISRRSELLPLLADKAILVDKINFGLLVLNILREIKRWNGRLYSKMTTDNINIFFVVLCILKSLWKIVPIFELNVATARVRKCAICSGLCWKIHK
jgi:hypothetical protein